MEKKSGDSLISASQLPIFSGFFAPLWQQTKCLWRVDKTKRHLGGFGNRIRHVSPFYDILPSTDRENIGQIIP